MKTIFTILVALVFAGVIYLAIAGNSVQSIKTEIDISAPPTEVWNIIADIDKWQEWSPVINASEGDASVGSTLSITMMGKKEGKDGPKYSPEIIQLDEPNYFHWRAHMMSSILFTNEKIFELEKTGSGTKVTHTETFKGLLTPLFHSKMEKGVTPILDSMNKALKELAESTNEYL